MNRCAEHRFPRLPETRRVRHGFQVETWQCNDCPAVKVVFTVLNPATGEHVEQPAKVVEPD